MLSAIHPMGESPQYAGQFAHNAHDANAQADATDAEDSSDESLHDIITLRNGKSQHSTLC